MCVWTQAFDAWLSKRGLVSPITGQKLPSAKLVPNHVVEAMLRRADAHPFRTHAHGHTQMPARTLARTHTGTHAHSHARTLTRTHAHMHARSHERTLARTHAPTHAHWHARTLARTQSHARTLTRSRAQTHAHSHARTLAPLRLCSWSQRSYLDFGKGRSFFLVFAALFSRTPARESHDLQAGTRFDPCISFSSSIAPLLPSQAATSQEGERDHGQATAAQDTRPAAHNSSSLTDSSLLIQHTPSHAGVVACWRRLRFCHEIDPLVVGCVPTARLDGARIHACKLELFSVFKCIACSLQICARYLQTLFLSGSSRIRFQGRTRSSRAACCSGVHHVLRAHVHRHRGRGSRAAHLPSTRPEEAWP
eukprot:6175994-Pleurochrysis_carterae.AAC.2